METNNAVRPKSSLTVLERSRELHLLLSKVVLDDNLLNHVYLQIIGKPVTDHSQAVYELLAVANTLDLYDKDLTDERRKYQTEALRELTKLLASLRILYSISGMDGSKMKILIDKTIEVERLLKKWIESDKNRIGISLGIVKKDEIDTHIFEKKVTAHDLFTTQNHVDFDTLLKDSRNTPPAYTLDRNGNRQALYVPPAETRSFAPVRNPIYVQKSDDDMEDEFRLSRLELNRLPNPSATPAPKGKHDIAIPTRPVQIITVRKDPIVVPDNRTVPDPPPPTLEEQLKQPLDPHVEIMSKATPEIMTEGSLVEAKKDEESKVGTKLFGDKEATPKEEPTVPPAEPAPPPAPPAPSVPEEVKLPVPTVTESPKEEAPKQATADDTNPWLA